MIRIRSSFDIFQHSENPHLMSGAGTMLHARGAVEVLVDFCMFLFFIFFSQKMHVCGVRCV